MSVKSFFQARWFLAALVVLALSPRTNGDIICNPGYTLVDDNCTMCVAGKHKQESGHMPCRSCPANSDSPAGSTAQGACKCNAGYSGDASAENPACTACSAGRYKTVNGSASCLSCPLYFNSPMGSASFADCIHEVAVLNIPFPSNSSRSSVKQYPMINKDQHMRFEYDSSYDNGFGQSEYILELRQDTTVSLLVVGGGGGGGLGAYESGGGGGGGIIYMVDKTLITGFYKIFVGSGGASGVTGYDSKIITFDGRSVIFDGLSVVGKGGGAGASGVVVLRFVNCPSGTFANTTTCDKCPAFSTSPAGSNTSSACSCNAGYTGNADIPGGTCAACGAGTYKEASGNVTCRMQLLYVSICR